MELLKAFLGGAGGAALATGLFMIIKWFLDRKAAKEDGTEKHNAASCAARGKEIRDLKATMEVLILADRTILYDRIKHLGKSYIARGYITMEELEDLERMHRVYHDKDKLNGNGFLDGLMATVRSLPLRAA